MFEVSWLLFVAASLVLIATPGQDMVLVLSRSIAQGAVGGIATALGVSVGLIGHSILATLGIGALLRASEFLFETLKLVGAGYLFYLGARMLFAKEHSLSGSAAAPQTFWRLFLNGAISNISNPKIAIFYFAFLPQFVRPASAHPTLAILVLGLVFSLLTFSVKAPVALFSAALSGWLRSRPGVLKYLHRTSGAVLIALSARLAVAKRS